MKKIMTSRARSGFHSAQQLKLYYQEEETIFLDVYFHRPYAQRTTVTIASRISLLFFH